MSVIRAFSKLGVPLELGEIDALCSRSWVLDGIGQANIQIAKTSPAFTAEMLRFGNRILIEEDDMGSWGGIVLPPQPWDENSATLTVFTVEQLLKDGRYPSASSYTGYAGNIFEDLIASANAIEDTLIDLGAVYVNGISWTEETTESTYSVLSKIAKRTGQDWEIEPYINPVGNLAWYANWHEKRGADLRNDVTLEEGVHFKVAGTPLMTLQGPIYNSIKLIAYNGVGITTTVTTPNNDASRAEYGLLQGVINETVPSGYTAQTYHDHLLDFYGWPRRTFKLSIINDDVDTLKSIRLGNVITLNLVTYGFSGNNKGLETAVRILTIDADERDSTLTVIANEVM